MKIPVLLLLVVLSLAFAFNLNNLDSRLERFHQVYSKVHDLWTNNPRSVQIETKIGTTHVNLAGNDSNPAVLLLHGKSATSVSSYHLANALSDDFFVIAPDIIGDSGKSVATSVPAKNAGYADWVSELCAGLSISEVAVIGESFGGGIATEFAAKYPQNVKDLVLICPVSLGPSVDDTMMKKGMMAVMFRSYNRAYEMIDWNHTDGKPRDELVFELYARAIQCIDLENHTPEPEISSNEILQKLSSDTLVIWGELDRNLNAEVGVERARNHIRNLEVQTYADSGHLVAMEKSEEVTANIRQFLLK